MPPYATFLLSGLYDASSERVEAEERALSAIRTDATDLPKLASTGPSLAARFPSAEAPSFGLHALLSRQAGRGEGGAARRQLR